MREYYFKKKYLEFKKSRCIRVENIHPGVHRLFLKLFLIFEDRVFNWLKLGYNQNVYISRHFGFRIVLSKINKTLIMMSEEDHSARKLVNI